MFTLLSRYWWVLVVRGVIAILFGVTAFMLPIATLAVLVLAFGLYVFLDGVAACVTAIVGRAATPGWWIVLLHGVLGIGIGLLTLFSPAVTVVVLLLYIAVWAVFAGLLQVLAAVKLREELTGEWWLALGGLLGVAFGVVMMWRPGVGALALLWLIASYAIVWGVALVIGGLEIRRAARQPAAA